uniref:hypothetical protein n=1 Tax=Chryseobacterium sp. Marseille-Q3244 TaxID=2758092 RepID=UPI002024DF8E
PVQELKQGIKIVMTSRDYIYNRARNDLKESAFPLFNESQAFFYWNKTLQDLLLNLQPVQRPS